MENRSFKRKHEVLLTVKDILRNLREGNVPAKISKKKESQESMKEVKGKEESIKEKEDEGEERIDNSDDFLYDLLYGNPS